uniref:Uncharacterized protein n=2 Tax=Clytia hemisphaerica TaxID=252671 RepID=A0A7M5XFZ2_9CNID
KKKPPIECVPAGMTQVTDVRHNWETNSHTLHQHHSLHSVTLFGKKTKNGYQFSHFSTPGFGNSILNNQFGDAIKNVFEEQFMDAYPLQKKTQPSTTTEPDALASTTTEPDALASTTTEPDALASTITEPDALASTTSTTEKDFYSVEEVLTMTDNS